MDIAEEEDLVTAQSFMLNPRRKAERRFNMKPQMSTRHELKLAEQAKGRGMRRKSRANSITVSSGVAGMRGPVAEEDLKVLQESLRHFMFLGLEVQQNHTKFLSCFREARYVQGDKLIIQGNPAEHLQSFHVISDGEIGVTVDGRQVAVCKAGDHLGELSLLFKSLPSATCEVVSETAKTWVMTGADFRQQTRMASENSFAQRSLWLGEMESLSGLMPIQLKELSQSMSLLTVEPGMGIPADLLPQFVVITTGMVELSRKDRPAGGAQSGGMEDDDALPTHHVAEHGQCCPVTTEQCELAGAGDASELAIVAGPKGVQLLHLPLPAFEMATGEAFADTRDRSLVMQILRGHAAFTHLDELQQRAISKLVSIVKFEAGAEYVKENDEEMVIVLDGSLAVGRVSEPGGQPVRRSMHRRGSTTGVEALYVAQNNSAGGKSSKTIYIGDTGARLGIIEREGVQEVLDGKHLDETSVEANTSKNAVRALRKDIAFDSLKEIAKLGQGTFGRVSLVSAPAGAADDEGAQQRRYALKVMLKDTVVENEQEEHVMDEKRVLQMLDHPFVISLVATFQTRESLYLLMECCYGGELWAVIHEKHGRDNPMPPDSVRFYAACICSALGHMHLKGIIFRDLKPENVLVANNGYLKIADMGLAKVLPYIGHDEKTGGEVIHHKAFTVCGTPEYISPEIIYNLGHDRYAPRPAPPRPPPPVAPLLAARSNAVAPSARRPALSLAQRLGLLVHRRASLRAPCRLHAVRAHRRRSRHAFQGHLRDARACAPAPREAHVYHPVPCARAQAAAAPVRAGDGPAQW